MAVVSAMAVAQTTPDGIFTYKDADGTVGYYLGLGEPDHIPGMIIAFDEIARTCIYLGADPAEAKATMETIMSMFREPADTAREFAARPAIGGMLTASGTCTAIVKKRFMAGKYICFKMSDLVYTTETYLRRSEARAFLSSLNEME